MGAAEVEAFLSWLATERNVAAATQNQALSALQFLYKELLGQNLPWFKDLHHDGLHARTQQGRTRGGEPARPARPGRQQCRKLNESRTGS